MKKIAYIFYGMIFNAFRIFPVGKNKVVFLMIHNCRFKGNFKFIYDEMIKREIDFEFVKVSKEQLFNIKDKGFKKLIKTIKNTLYFYFIVNYHLASANYIYLNDNFQPLAYMKVSKKTKIIQLWHGIGAFKRFGLSTEKDKTIRNCTKKANKKVSHLFISSKKLIPFYEEAFGITKDRIYATGLPIIDFYFDNYKMKQAKYKANKALPTLKNKKVILYTPTFRSNDKENLDLLKTLDNYNFKKALGEEWRILLRLHPKINNKFKFKNLLIINVTDYEDIKGLFLISDILVNDYSSVIIEYALLNKPMYLYAYDLSNYDRGFYIDYKKMAPCPIAYNLDQLTRYIKEDIIYQDKLNEFINLQYDFLDKYASKRVLDIILGEKDARN